MVGCSSEAESTATYASTCSEYQVPKELEEELKIIIHLITLQLYRIVTVLVIEQLQRLLTPLWKTWVF